MITANRYQALAAALLLCLPLVAGGKVTLPYRDTTLAPERRAADLLSRMTLDEKVAQLQCRWQEKTDFLDEGEFNERKARTVMPHGIGTLARMNEDFHPGYKPYYTTLHAGTSARQYNRWQRYFVENTRLGIPVLNHQEALHGLQAMDATVFPMPIAMASSWDRGLYRDVYTYVSREACAVGGHQVLAPVVDITQDPRWGRTEETMGEDPFLASELGIVQVRAFQGTQAGPGTGHCAVTLKHLGIHGRSEGGCNTAPSFVDEHTARELFLYPFERCIKEAQPWNVMACYAHMWGTPSHMNGHLIGDILRRDWGYQGLVVSDYDGVSNLVNIDHATPDYDEAGILALTAGVDCELPSTKSYANLAQMVRAGRLEEKHIDRAVMRILTEKFRLGLFEHPYVDADAAERLLGGSEGQALAYRAATESMVLLQNKGSLLPLDSTRIRTIALIGPNADRCVLGGYSNIPRHAVSLRQAMERRFGDRMRIVCEEGVRIFASSAGRPDDMRELTAEDNAERIRRAVEAAGEADAIVLCLGENDSIHREATSEYTLGDLPTLELLGGQLDLVREIAALGKPTVALVSSGTTLSLAPVAEQVPALMQCWYLGQEGGYAMADALFGKVCPSGKLTISFPRSAGHVPCYYNYKPSSRRGYNLQKDVTPAYPFGYGLSYTTFRYSPLRLGQTEIEAGGSTTVSVDITNTGRREAAEVVQLYITDDYCLMPRPVKELRGFERITLKPGETRTVSFTLGPKELAALDTDFRRQVEPGTFTIQVGPSSAEGETLTLRVK